MDTPYNPAAGTSFSDGWYYRRKAPRGRVVHLIDPVGLGPLCDEPLRKDWIYVPEEVTLKLCVKCKGIELRASVSEEIDNERLK
jgi:hypothetical protein